MNELRKIFALAATKAAGDPSTEQLALINAYTLNDLAATDVYVRTAYLAHNGIDRDGEVFDDALLADFARTLPGKGLFVRHPGGWDGDSGPGVGRWFSARVVEMSHAEARAALRQPGLRWPAMNTTAKLLECSFYIPRTGKNQDLIADIDAGVARDQSIGFRAADRSAITDEHEQRVAWRLHAPGEALEGSLVWLGAQPGAGVHKSASNLPIHTTEDPAMKLTDDQIKKLQDEHAAFKAQIESLSGVAETLKAVQAAVGDDLVANPAALKQAVEDGQAYRKELIDGIVKAKRLLGMVGDSEDDAKAAAALYAHADISTLKTEAAGYAKQATQGGRLQGGDPNTTGAARAQDPGEQEEKDLTNPLDNPLLFGAAG